MEQIIEKNVRFCGCCHRELPVDSFYVDKRTLAPDNYCKECRLYRLLAGKDKIEVGTQDCCRVWCGQQGEVF